MEGLTTMSAETATYVTSCACPDDGMIISCLDQKAVVPPGRSLGCPPDTRWSASNAGSCGP
jgi:hypothetical protein